ncbi:MAG: FAD/NAD(P)-binding oxidoreductase, partial [bacterium]|nr:FAD/NAD(P)-binding oxidoreductase [bacterium]
MTQYVIIGGGIAGTTAAGELRKLDPESSIVLIGEEEHRLYSRVILPQYAEGKVDREKCFLKKEEWYQEQNIEYLRSEFVSEIDTKNKHVVLKVSQREIPYDKLLIASGGEPRYVDYNEKGVVYLQTMSDTDNLVQLLQEISGKKDVHMAICGGGFIACEFLNIFGALNLPMTIFYRGPRFWSQVMDEESGKLLENHLKEKGVKIWPSTNLVGVEEKDGRLLIETDEESCQADILGVGIGLTRDLGWIADAGVDTENGVLTNEYLETNIPDVYAIGDVSEFFNVVIDRHFIAGNWMNAQMQGRAVAKTMSGERTLFRLTTSYAMKVLGMDVMFIGDTRREMASEILVRGIVESGYIIQMFLSGEKIVGATLIGANTDRMTLTKIIDQQVDISAMKETL